MAPLVGVALALVAAPAQADNAELITVTPTSAMATWVTATPSDTTVCWGHRSAAERCSTQESGATRHYAVMDRIAPGAAYVYELRSGGAAELPGLANPGLHVERIRQVEQMGATVVCLQNASGVDPHAAFGFYGEKVLPALRG